MWKFFKILGVCSCILGCSPSNQINAETTLYVGLHTLYDTVTPVSDITQRACVQKQDAELAGVRAGVQTTAVAEAHIKEIRAKCDHLRVAFDKITDSYNAAVGFVKEGYYDRAQEQLKQIQAIWDNIKRQNLLP